MRIIPLSVIGFYLGLLSAFSQTPQQDDSSTYKNRKLKTYEVNFIGSYYSQDGNHSAVTGGTGTEKLTDFSTAIDLLITRKDTLDRTHSWNFEIAADAYSSASSDKIDPTTISSASSQDIRYYPSASYTIRNERKHHSIGFEGSFSQEFDYTSFGTALNLSKFSKDNNREVSLKLQAFFDRWKIILPIELRGNMNGHSVDLSKDQRNSFNASIVFSQIVNSRFQFAIIADPSYQQGLLGTLFNRIYFADNSLSVEKLPDTRTKYPIGLRMNYFLTDQLILRTFLRYYTDDWDLKSNTFSIETPYKISPLFSVSPFYRFYTQTAIKYFAGYKEHLPSEEFYSSDYDLSEFNSQFFGINLRKVSVDGIFGIKTWNTIELRYGYYMRSDGLRANTITLALMFK